MLTTHTPNKAASQTKPQNQETNSSIPAMRKVIAGNGNDRDLEDATRLLDRLTRNSVGKLCKLCSADQADVRQAVLREMVSRGLFDPHLGEMIAEKHSDERVLARLCTQIDARVRSRTLDYLRTVESRRETSLDEASGALAPDPSSEPPLPEARHVLTALRRSRALRKAGAGKEDRRLLAYMIEHGASANQTAEANEIHHSRVDRAVDRLRPLLRKLFKLEP